jgi:hypothetical protein
MATRKRRASKRNRTGRLPPPGPSQCHPKNKGGAHGCLPLPELEAAARRLRVSGPKLRANLLKALKLPAETGDRTLAKALGISADHLLRPAAPDSWIEDPDKWLDSNNITNCLSQWEESNPEFEFMGPFPIDFAAADPYKKGPNGEKVCLMSEMCSLRVTEAIKNGTKAIGIVYNLDPHYKSGSHWVANYIDIPGKRCYYFDSYGMEPPKQVATFMKWLTTQDPQMRLEYNARRLQYKNTECGIYCIYFIIRMLLGDSFKEFTRRNPTDAEMIRLRKWLFST